MLTAATRAYTEAELDEYSDRMGSRAATLAMIATVAILVGSLSTLGAFAVHWLYAWLTSGSATWTYPLYVGGAVALLVIVGLWWTSDSDAWTEQPPELATDVTATAYAAWVLESDSLDIIHVFRVEADRYLVLTENALTPPIRPESACKNAPADTVPSNITLVLLGEGEFRVALRVSLTGPTIPLTAAEIPTDDDETPIPDGLYTTSELPPRIQRALSLT